LKVGKMKLGMGAHEEGNYACAPTTQPPTINHQHSPSLQDYGSLHKHENFEELMQTLIENPQTKHNMQTHPEPFPYLIQ
jgi:hypothetical protein